MKFKVFLPAVILLLSILCSDDLRAMAILDFGKMTLDDESTYVALLVTGSAKLLRARGEPNQAQRTIDLFKDSTKAGGVNQLAMNLKILEAENDHNAINPRNELPVYEVEDAMRVTLKNKGINVSTTDLLAITKDFIRVNPPRSQAP